MNIPRVHPRLITALSLASALAGAFALSPRATASALDPADPYQYTGGQYPAYQHSFGLPPQFTGEESMGMRQARFANGAAGGALVSAFNDGAVAFITVQPAAAAGNQATPAVSTQVAMNAAPVSPVMSAIRVSLRAIAQTKGAVAVTDSDDIASSVSGAPYEAHTLLGVYQLRVNASDRDINALQARSAQFAGDQQSQFNAAVQEVQNNRARLLQDFAAARNATPDNWEQVRATLASDYRQYSDSVARAQRLANGGSA